MDTHSSHMESEKEGLEREAEAKAIAAQQKADLEHLTKNVHPSLRDAISLGDKSDGTTQTLSDYSAQILSQKIETLKEWHDNLCLEFSQLKNDFESLRLQVVPYATPETPLEEVTKETAADPVQEQVMRPVPEVAVMPAPAAEAQAPQVQQ